jgi:hypothetical protein
MNKKDKLEPLADGWVAFHTESGERWKHKDFVESDATGPAGNYRLFANDRGEQRRYAFGPKDPRDSTVWDLRQQLARSEPVSAGAATT